MTNEDLQSTMIQVLRIMEKISVETWGEVSRLCSITRALQRKLEVEFSTPTYAVKNNLAEEGSGLSLEK